MNRRFSYLDAKQVFEQEDQDGWLDVSFKIRGDGSKSILTLLQHCQIVGGGGHSFDIVIDPDSSDHRRTVGFDGDGADQISDIKVNGKMVERGCFLKDDKKASIDDIAKRVADGQSADLSLPEVSLPHIIKNKINRALTKMTYNTYFPSIPLDDIFAILEANEVGVIMEDGRPWSGFLTGHSGEGNFDLACMGRKVKNAVLRMTWYHMASGNWEIVAYVG